MPRCFRNVPKGDRPQFLPSNRHSAQSRPRYYEGEQEASLDVPTYEVHHHDKAGNIIPEEDEVVLNEQDVTEADTAEVPV